MGTRPETEAKKEKYSWHIYVDKSLKRPVKMAANAANMEVREFLSQEIEKCLFGGNATG